MTARGGALQHTISTALVAVDDAIDGDRYCERWTIPGDTSVYEVDTGVHPRFREVDRMLQAFCVSAGVGAGVGAGQLADTTDDDHVRTAVAVRGGVARR